MSHYVTPYKNVLMDDTHIDPAWLDRGPGSGSLSWSEAMQDSTSRRPSHDGRAETRTTFYRDFDDPQRTGHYSWEELAALNDDMYHPDRAKQNHQSDKDRIVEILCSEVDCTAYQANRVARILADLDDLREFRPTATIEQITLAIISLVVDSETTDFDDRISARQEFVDLRDDLGLGTSELWTMREKIRTETTHFE